jgi:hypothetical protein
MSSSTNDEAWDEYLSTGIDPTGGQLDPNGPDDKEYEQPQEQLSELDRLEDLIDEKLSELDRRQKR